jgi:hypothetical protein
MKEHIPLKYECLDRYLETLSKCKDDEIKFLLIDMFDLIRYQMTQITDQRMVIIGLKHKESWKHYDRPIEEYDTEKRSYIDKPAKSGNMSC